MEYVITILAGCFFGFMGYRLGRILYSEYTRRKNLGTKHKITTGSIKVTPKYATVQPEPKSTDDIPELEFILYSKE